MADIDDDISAGLPTISPAIPGRWVHSFEEDADGVETYRSEGFEFPPAPRDALEITRHGTVTLDEVDPAGEICRAEGRWRQPTHDRLAVTFDDDRASFMLQAVQDVDLGLLRVRRLPEPSPTISPAIPGRWVHSFEEDADGIETYRSEGFEFPPGPRDGFELLRNFTFILDEVGPTGDTAHVRGRWQQPTDDRLAVSFVDGDHAAFILQAVEDVDVGFLRVLRLPEPSPKPLAAT